MALVHSECHLVSGYRTGWRAAPPTEQVGESFIFMTVYSVIERKDPLTHATTQMSLRDVTLRGVSLSPKHRHCRVPLTQGSQAATSHWRAAGLSKTIELGLHSLISQTKRRQQPTQQSPSGVSESKLHPFFCQVSKIYNFWCGVEF